MLGQRHDTLAQVGIGVADGFHALGGAVAKEVDRMLIEPRTVGVGVDHIGLDAAHRPQRTVVDGGVDLHAAGVEHRTEQGVVGQLLVAQQHGHGKQFEGGNGDERQVAGVADALGHRHANAQTGVGAGAAAHGHRVEGYAVVVGEGEGLVDKYAQTHRMVGTLQVGLLEKEGSILAYGHRTHIGARLNV